MPVVPIIKVQPVEDETVEQLKAIFHQHYKGCQIDIDNIRDFDHTGFNSELKLVDVIIKENGRQTKVPALIKTTERKRMKKLLCCLTRYMMREVIFYTQILPTLIRCSLDDKEKLMLQELAPRCYFGFSNQITTKFKRTMCETLCCWPLWFLSRKPEVGIILLEDLTKRAGQIVAGLDKNQLMDFDHINTALTTLAHFHGSTWRWIERQKMGGEKLRNSKDFSLEEMQELHKDTWFLGFCFQQIFRLMRTMLKKFLENRKEGQAIICKLDNFMKSEIFGIMQGIWTNCMPSKFDTIVHGDFWCANILYKYDKDHNPEKAILVDYQQIDLGNPCRDICSLIYSSTDSSFRTKHMDSLLKNYFTIFQDYFGSFYFMSSCSYEEFYKVYADHRKFGFAWGLYMVCIVLCPEVKIGWEGDISIRDILVRRFELIASVEENVPKNFIEIRKRLLDLIKEARAHGVI